MQGNSEIVNCMLNNMKIQAGDYYRDLTVSLLTAGVCVFKICDICSNLRIKTPESHNIEYYTPCLIVECLIVCKTSQKQPFLGGVLRITIKLLCTSAWVFSCKFAAYFQNTFTQEHLCVAASDFYTSHFLRNTYSYVQDINIHRKIIISYYITFGTPKKLWFNYLKNFTQIGS